MSPWRESLVIRLQVFCFVFRKKKRDEKGTTQETNIYAKDNRFWFVPARLLFFFMSFYFVIFTERLTSLGRLLYRYIFGIWYISVNELWWNTDVSTINDHRFHSVCKTTHRYSKTVCHAHANAYVGHTYSAFFIFKSNERRRSTVSRNNLEHKQPRNRGRQLMSIQITHFQAQLTM